MWLREKVVATSCDRQHAARARTQAFLNDVDAVAAAGQAPVVVAAVKTMPASDVAGIVQGGIRHLAENAIPFDDSRREAGGEAACWHYIGRLQGRKCRAVATACSWVQSLDAHRHAARLSRYIDEAERPSIQSLLQLNLTDDLARAGVRTTDDLLMLAERVTREPGVTIRGLMAMAPAGLTDDDIGRAFARARAAFERLRRELGGSFDTLSMGMSQDWRVAIREGATMIRIGSVLRQTSA